MSFDDEEHRVKRILDEEQTEQETEQNSVDHHDLSHANTSNSENSEDSPIETGEVEKEVENSEDKPKKENFYGYGQIEEESAIEQNEDKSVNSGHTENSENEFTYPPSLSEEEAREAFEKSLSDEAIKSDGLSEEEALADATAYIPPSKAYVKEKKKKAEQSEPMGLLDHLGELRRRLTRIVIIVLLGFFGFYGIAEIAYAYLALPLTQLLPEGSTLIYTSPQGAFFTYLKVSLMLSVIGTSPLTFYQLWAFIAPGLYKEEQHAIIPLALFSALFFISGAAFCYFLVFPIAFKFFLGFTTETIIPMISVEEYLSFALKLVIAFGLVFEMPLFSYFLAKLRLLTPQGMRKYRKYAILAIFCIAAILTPPDVFSQILMAMPMIILYEVSIYIAKVARSSADKRHEAKSKENEDENTENEESVETKNI